MEKTLLFLVFLFVWCNVQAQELDAKISINHSRVDRGDADIFNDLKQSLERFVNERQWTDVQYAKQERISCSFNITVGKYDKSTSTFECSTIIQASRPVFDSQYTTTLYSNKDDNFSFKYKQNDQLNYNDNVVDNQLTALFAYYAYLIIGMDLDSFSPLGGTEVLQRCLYLVNNCQSLEFPGWKAFDNDRNRFALINDYMEESMKSFRQLQYDYHRLGLDEMASNVERGRTNITTALEERLKKAHQDRPMSLFPQIWTDYKKDELANIYKGKGTQKEKETVYDILMGINASQSLSWNKIKQ